jgi:hypothetical protein
MHFARLAPHYSLSVKPDLTRNWLTSLAFWLQLRSIDCPAATASIQLQ